MKLTNVLTIVVVAASFTAFQTTNALERLPQTARLSESESSPANRPHWQNSQVPVPQGEDIREDRTQPLAEINRTPQQAVFRKQMEQQPVQFVHRLNTEKTLSLQAPITTLSSKSWSRKISGDILNKGISLYTDADEAIIRITPITSSLSTANSGKSSATSLQPADLIISSAQGKLNAGDNQASVSAKSSQLKALYPEMFDKTSAFKVAKQLGHGEIQLRAVKALAANDQYLIQLFDKNSNLQLSVQQKRHSVGAGQSITVTPRTSQGRIISKHTSWLDGSGVRHTSQLNNQGGRLTGPIPLLIHKPGELVELVLTAKIEKNGLIFQRDLKIPFDLHVKTAVIGQGIRVKQSATQVSFEVPLAIHQASRYEIRSLVSGRDKQGKKRTAVQTFSADTLQPGTGSITTTINKIDLIGAGLRPPFYVTEIQLLDQGQVSQLQTRKVKLPLFTIRPPRARMKISDRN